MKHLILFENNKNIIYTCTIVYDNDNNRSDMYAFNDKLSRNNFIINYIHNFYKEYNKYYVVKGVIDIYELIEIFNEDDGDTKIFSDEAEMILKNIKLIPELQTIYDTKKYNL